MLIPMIDALKFSVDIENYEESIEKYVEKLDSLKIVAKSNSTNLLSDKVTVTIGKMTFEVLPNGSKGYLYILHNDNYEVKLSRFRSKSKNFYPIMISIKQRALWSISPSIALNDIYIWIIENFGNIISNKISRIDLCTHTDLINFAKCPLENFKGKFTNNQIVLTHRETSTITFGGRSSRVYCRIYNKTLEVKQKTQKAWFKDVWNDKGYNSSVDVWNIEFELKREFFKDFELDSIESVLVSLKSIWEYLTCNWLILTENNTTRIENAQVNCYWKMIQDCFFEYESKPLIKRQKQHKRYSESLVPALTGYLKSFSAYECNPDLDRSLSLAKNAIEDYQKNKGSAFSDDVIQKILLIN